MNKSYLQTLSIAAFLGLFIVILSTFFVSSQVFSQEQGKAITVIPPRFELFANPGETVTERIRVRNESDFPVNYAVVIEDFTAAGEEGHVVLEEDSNTNFSLAKWMEPESKELILQPKEERAVSFRINVPRSAEPGGHYASVLFSSAGEQTPGAAAVTQRIGSLVLLRVSGNVTENATIETFEAPSYLQNGPVEISLRVKNEGNVHVRPKGTIIITNLFNKKVDEIPLNGSNIIPGSVRKMITTWDKKNILGVYKATMVSTYGEQNVPLTAATRFTVASPLALTLIGIGSIALLIFLLSLISGRKRLGKAFKALSSD